VSSKLAKLKKKSCYVPEKDGVSGLDALMLNSLADGIAHIGAVSSAKTGDDWAYSEVEVIPGVGVSTRIPPGRLIEMDGITLIKEMVNAADRVLPFMFNALLAESQAAHSRVPHAHILLGINRGDSWNRVTVTVAVVRQLLEMQGWKFVSSVNRWRSPAWLFPPVMLKLQTLYALIKEEVLEREGNLAQIEGPLSPLDVFDE